LERSKYHKYSGVNKAKRCHEKENARTQDHLDDIEANARRPGSID
jgi:hypothetical protein